MVSSSASVSLPKVRRLAWTGWCAVGALWLIGLLALVPQISGDLSISLTLFILMVASLVMCWNPIFDKLQEHPDVAVFCVTVIMFVVYGVARRFDGVGALTLHSGFLEGDQYVLSAAAMVVFAGTVLAAPSWICQFKSWVNAVIAALFVLAILGLGSFWFLSQYYTVGPTDILDPTPLLPLAMHVLEFFCLTLLCAAVCAENTTRKVLLKSLPLMLILLFVRHAFINLGDE